jgi:hypothetical protein
MNTIKEAKMTKGGRNDPPTTPRPSEPKGQQPIKSYPECEKMQKVSLQSNVVGEFLDWLSNKKNLSICEFHDAEDDSPFIDKDTGKPAGLYHNNSITNPDYYPTGHYPYHYQIEELLAEFFEIDLNKVEQERRQILEDLQK